MKLAKRSKRVDRFAFTTAVTVASRALILRDKLLGRMKRTRLDYLAAPGISKRKIPSGNQILDAVFVSPAGERTRAALLICHGIGETVDHWGAVQTLLAAHGVASLVFDYAGYGGSTGIVDWEQCEEDSIAAFGALKSVVPGLPIGILGFSMGSGIAAAVLDRIAPQNLILCSAFTSFREAACSVGLPRVLSFLAPPIWNNLESLRRCSHEALILHCEQDRVFPTRMASSLAACCGSGAKLVVVPNQKHNEPFYRPQFRYWNHVISLLMPDQG